MKEFFLKFVLLSVSTINGLRDPNLCHIRGIKRCCRDYKEARGSCLPCPYGTFGIDCSNTCPFGYYGFKCQQKCNCSKEEACSPVFGCANLDGSEQMSYLQKFGKGELTHQQKVHCVKSIDMVLIMVGVLSIGSIGAVVTFRFRIWKMKIFRIQTYQSAFTTYSGRLSDWITSNVFPQREATRRNVNNTSRANTTKSQDNDQEYETMAIETSYEGV